MRHRGSMRLQWDTPMLGIAERYIEQIRDLIYAQNKQMRVPVKLMQVGDASHSFDIDARIRGNLLDVSRLGV